MPEHHQFSIHINLAALTSRIQRHLQASINLVAIGLNAKKGISMEDLQLPEVTTHHKFDSSNQWTVEQAGEGHLIFSISHLKKELSATISSANSRSISCSVGLI